MAKRYRSFLFVPANKAQFAPKAVASGADAIIIDLEDSISPSGKNAARDGLAAIINALGEYKGGIFVRINPWMSGHLLNDVASLRGLPVTGVMLPKIRSSHDIKSLDMVLSEEEKQSTAENKPKEIFPIWETPYSMITIFECCQISPRIARCAGGFLYSPGGDRDKALGISGENSFAQYHFASKSVLDARAAGVENVIAGPCTDIENLRMVKRMAMRARMTGCNGAMSIHPSHISLLNQIFSPTQHEITDAVSILNAIEEAVDGGTGVTLFNGKMIDIAMARSAIDVLDQAYDFGLTQTKAPERIVNLIAASGLPVHS